MHVDVCVFRMNETYAAGVVLRDGRSLLTSNMIPSANVNPVAEKNRHFACKADLKTVEASF